LITLLIILIIIGIILETISLKRDPDEVEVYGLLSTRVSEPGDTFDLQTTVTNKSLIPISYLAVREVLPAASVLPDGIVYRSKLSGSYTKKICRLRGRQRKTLIMETSINKRGVHIFSGDYVDFGDFLGFREISRDVTYEQEIVVYPEKLVSQRLANTLAKFTGDVNAKRHLIRDPIITVGCREYTGREPMKEIHWTKSAQRNELVVREFDYNRQISVSVILNVEGINLHDEEGLDECCAIARTVCESLVGTGATIRFFTNSLLKRKSNRTVWQCRVSSGHTGELLEGLGRVTAYFNNPLDKLLDFSLRESDFDSAFIVIMHPDDIRGNDAIHRLRSNTGGEALLVQSTRINEGEKRKEEQSD